MSLQIQVIENQIDQLMTHAASSKNGELMLALYGLTANMQLVKDQVVAHTINLVHKTALSNTSVVFNDSATTTEHNQPVVKVANPKPQYSITVSGKKTEKVTATSTVTPIQAAKISGKSVSTITRMLVDGSLSGTQSENGRRSTTVQAVFDAFNLIQPVTGRRQIQ